MDQALIQVGLPVQCAYGDCGQKGFVKPRSDYGGWYKSKLFRFRPRKRWYCPEHHDFGKQRDDHFYDRYKTPEPPVEEKVTESTTEELYKLLDQKEDKYDTESINPTS